MKRYSSDIQETGVGIFQAGEKCVQRQGQDLVTQEQLGKGGQIKEEQSAADTDGWGKQPKDLQTE